jgi:hypothetical protein
MPSDKPRIVTYTTKEIADKFQYISKSNNRTASNQLECMIIKCIKDYEAENGEIIID